MSDWMLGTRVTGRCLVRSDMAGAWRPALWAIPFGAPMAVVVWNGATIGGVFITGLWLVHGLFALGWVAHRYRCRDDSLWDEGNHLVWARGGKVVSCVAWADLVDVQMSPGKRLPSIPPLRQGRPPTVPRISIESLARPSSTFYVPWQRGETWHGTFGSLILVTRATKRRAAEQLAAALQEHGLPRSRPPRPRTIREAMRAEADRGGAGLSAE